MPEHPKPPPPPPPIGDGGKAAAGSFVQWMKDVITGPYTDDVKEKTIVNTVKK